MNTKKYLLPVLCVLPFVGVALWFLSGKNVGNMFTFGLILACPLSHLFLMRHTDHKGHHENTKD